MPPLDVLSWLCAPEIESFGAFKKVLDPRRCDSRNLLEPSLAVVSGLRGIWTSTTLGWIHVFAGKLVLVRRTQNWRWFSEANPPLRSLTSGSEWWKSHCISHLLRSRTILKTRSTVLWNSAYHRQLPFGPARTDDACCSITIYPKLIRFGTNDCILCLMSPKRWWSTRSEGQSDNVPIRER